MSCRCSAGAVRALTVLLLLLVLPAALPAPAAAEDVEVSTTFLTFFKDGGGYIEYRLQGSAAADLRRSIDDPAVVFPFETRLADGDGTVDQSEVEQYTKNLDHLLTKRVIVLRGVKMDNVDVDEHRGLVGSGVNETEELLIHITFRGHIQYDERQFNVSGLEPLAVLYGSYEDIPPELTVDERTFIVAAGTGSYETVTKGDGGLLNMRAPLAAVVSYHDSYAVANVPTTRMRYDHSTVLGNPLVLMILVFAVTFLVIKLPKIVAKQAEKERVQGLHMGNLGLVVVFWLVYVFGGAAAFVWTLGVGLVVGAYLLAFLVYEKDWRGLAVPIDGIDLGESIAPADPRRGTPAPVDGSLQGRSILAGEAQGAGDARAPDGDVVVESDGGVQDPRPAAARPEAVPAAVGASKEEVPERGEEPEAGDPGTKTLRCKCKGLFQVPLQPRPLEVQCPHCGTKGTLTN